MKQEDLEATIHESLAAAGIPKDAIAKALKEVRAAIQSEKSEKEPKSRSKAQWVILANDKDGTLSAVETVAWALQLDEGAAPQSALDRIHAAANSFNSSHKGRKHPVTTIGETLEAVRGKHWKSVEHPTEKTLVKMREPVVVQFVPNVLRK